MTPTTTSPSSIFSDVSRMNEAFGNPRGNWDDLSPDDASKIIPQCRNIGDEHAELMTALAAKDKMGVRDALCDILVFTLGAFHLLGCKPPEPPASLMDTCGSYADPNFGDLAFHAAMIDNNQVQLMMTLDDGRLDGALFHLCNIVLLVRLSYRVLGADLEVDMRAVYDSNMSKFCKDELELQLTRTKYETLEIPFYEEGEFPARYLKASCDCRDANGNEFRRGKFLKGVNYREPVFAEP